MNWKQSLISYFPSLEEGRRADLINAALLLKSARRGGQTLCLSGSDLPGCAVVKVARHFTSTAQPPLLQGGNNLHSDSFIPP